MSSRSAPTISLVIPAWNEAAYLPRLLDSIDRARAQFQNGEDAVEIIVADNTSTDDTATIAESRGCHVVSVEKRCIAAARNGGAQAASGEIVAFADADFRVDPETFNFIDTVVSAPGYLGGATGLTMERWSLGIRLAWNMIMPPLWLLGLDGGVWFCRRSDFVTVGGFNEQVRAGEDVRFLISLKRLGHTRQPKERLSTRFTARKLGVSPAMAVNSARKFDQHGDWHMFSDAARNLPLALVQGRRRIDDYIDGYWYQGR
jgi:glycosyltransferase involved in cell wall biosynthesis